MTTPTTKTDTIRDLNDALRRTFVGGTVVVTAGIEALAADPRRAILAKVREFDAFSDDNDLYDEHDLGTVEECGDYCLWRIDYFDRAMTAHSPDPADPSLTTRVLTIMLTEEY
jgi:hypothetical protein